MQEDKIERESKLYDLSTLVVTIIEAQNVEFAQSSVTISVRDQAHSSPGFAGQFPQFNSQFKFTGASPNENIVVSIHNAYDELQTLTGTFPVRELLDQKIHDKWIAVKSPQKPYSDTKVHLQFQYIFSKAKISEEAIRDWRRLVEEYQAQNDKYKRDLEEMFKPFDFLTTLTNKPSYFTEIKPVDRFGNDVGSAGDLRAEVPAGAAQAAAPGLHLHDLGGLGPGVRGHALAGLQEPRLRGHLRRDVGHHDLRLRPDLLQLPEHHHRARLPRPLRRPRGPLVPRLPARELTRTGGPASTSTTARCSAPAATPTTSRSSASPSRASSRSSSSPRSSSSKKPKPTKPRTTSARANYLGSELI